MPRKVIYIGGPFRGPHAWAIRQNVHRAKMAAIAVAELGAVPLTPHSMNECFHGTISEEFWLEATRELLRRADALYVHAGPLTESTGTQGEIVDAEAGQIPVFYCLAELAAWMKAGIILRASQDGGKRWIGRIDHPGHPLDRSRVYGADKMDALDKIMRFALP